MDVNEARIVLRALDGAAFVKQYGNRIHIVSKAHPNYQANVYIPVHIVPQVREHIKHHRPFRCEAGPTEFDMALFLIWYAAVRVSLEGRTDEETDLLNEALAVLIRHYEGRPA